MPSTTRKPTAAESEPVSTAGADPASGPAPAASTNPLPEPAASANMPSAATGTELPPASAQPEVPGPAQPPAEMTDQGGPPLVGLVTWPVRVSQDLARDVAVTARNPEAVAYWGGLAALAVLGALEWPVAAAAGLGVVVAGAVRRGGG